MKSKDVRIISPIITAVAAFFPMVVGEYLAYEKGKIRFGEIYSYSGQKLLPIDISNYSPNMLQGLQLTFPKNLSPESIISSTPVSIEPIEHSSDSDLTIVKVSGIPPKQMSRLAIPLPENITKSCCSVINATDYDLEVISDRNVGLGFGFQLLRISILTAIICAVSWIGAHFFLKKLIQRDQERSEKKFEESKSKLKELKEDIAKSEAKKEALLANLRRDLEKSDTERIALLQTMKEEAREIKNRAQRTKTLLMSRLFEYSTEVTFWRDTIRKILYAPTTNVERGDKVVTVVIETLQTWKTLGKLPKNPESFSELENLLSNGNKQ